MATQNEILDDLQWITGHDATDTVSGIVVLGLIGIAALFLLGRK